MAKSRPQPTLADYLVIAVSPALIMLLVGSLVYFLVEISYSGQYHSRLNWILFWFIFASVLIGRIGIEQGSVQAGGYSLVLAIATAFVIMRYVDAQAVFIAWGLLALIWWCSNKLTWDCTLIDEKEDASGEGLLQVAGIDDENSQAPAEDATDDSAAGVNGDGNADCNDRNLNTPTAGSAQSIPAPVETRSAWWLRFFFNRTDKAGKPHTPGLWVVYFSLAALPLFGIGQMLIPQSDADGQRYGFQLLAVYVASALGLLLTTSFLGLRRYLRQRRLEMPGSMAGTWIVMGILLIAVTLGVCVLLPRPQSNYSITNFIDKIGSKVQEASKYSFLDDDSGDGEGQPGQQVDPDQEPQPGDQGEQQGQQGQGKQGKGQQGKGQQGKGQQSQDQQGQDQQGQNEQSQNQPGEKQQSQGQQSQNQQDQNQQDQNQQGQNEQRNNQNGSQRSGENRERDESQDESDQKASSDTDEQGQDGAEGREDAESQGTDGESSASSSSWGSTAEFLGTLVKWLIYALIAAVIVYLLLSRREQVLAFLRRLWQEWLALWASLFGRGTKETADDEDAATNPAQTRRPFADFPNPFTTGLAQKLSPSDLVSYTFDALQAWAYEQNLPRQPDQTPLEFGQLVSTRMSMMAKEVTSLVQLYARVAYAGHKPSRECHNDIERLWRRMTTSI